MSDRPAPNPPGPRRQSLKNVGGCTGVLSQLFQWNRLLGGSNKYIATPDVEKHSTSQKQMDLKRWTYQLKPVVLHTRQHLTEGEGDTVSSEPATPQLGSLNVCKVSDSMSQEIGMDLRQILHAKQEPFVLQDVIREKRQPRRSRSSRELNLRDDGSTSKARRLPRMKNTISKGQVQDEAVDSCHHKSASCSSHCGACQLLTGSVAVVKSNRVPAESMVAMPLHHAPGVSEMQSIKKAHSKVASPGKNPVKSPNKRALLMEAAAKILEGSNRRIPKPSSSSVRSLLEELEKSEHQQELSKPKEKLVRAAFLHTESSEREEILSQNVAICGEKLAESKQQKVQDSKFLSKQTNGSSCKHHRDLFHCFEKDHLIMQSRVSPYENALDEAEVLTTITTSGHSHNLVDEIAYVQGSRMEETQEISMNQMGMEGPISKSSEVLLQPKPGFAIVLPEVICAEKYQEFSHNAHTKERCKAIVPSELLPSMSQTCLSNSNSRTLPLVETFLDNSVGMYLWSYHPAHLPNLLSIAHTTCGIDAERIESSGTSSKLPTGASLIEAADVVVQACLLDLHTARHVKDSNTSHMFVEAEILTRAERQSSIPRLCNYSWWASCENNSSTQAVEKCEDRASQCSSPTYFSDECVGYDSPPITAPFAVKVFEERREANDCEEEASLSSGYSCVEEFQQSSPVSVLEPVYEEEPGDSFDYFDEARQKLLENVRRYEMLAHMDLDMLMKVSDEHLSHAWDDAILSESWETDSSSSHQQLSSPSQGCLEEHFSSSVHDVEAQDSLECYNDPYIFLPEETQYDLSFHNNADVHMQEALLRPNSDCLFDVREKFKPRRSSKVMLDCLSEASELVALRDPWTYEEIGKRTCSSGTVVVNALVCMDLTSNWSNSDQEVQEVEMELESTLFRILMCELLSDLLQHN